MKSCPLLFLYSFIQYAFDRELITGIENDRRNTWVYASTPTRKMSKTHPCASFYHFPTITSCHCLTEEWLKMTKKSMEICGSQTLAQNSKG